jgi:hypothetical protein
VPRDESLESSLPSEPSVTLDLGITMVTGVVDVVVGGVDVGAAPVVVGGSVVLGAVVLGAVVLGGGVDVVDTVVALEVLGVVVTVDVVDACAPTCKAEGTSAVAPPMPLRVMRATAPATPDNDATHTPQ